MKRIAPLVIMAIFSAHAIADGYGIPPQDIDQRLDDLVAAYPHFIEKRDENYIYMRGGTRFPISDGKTKKRFEDMLERPDIDDMFYFNYPAGQSIKAPEVNADPGRVRYEPLFVAMYGDCFAGGVTKHLRSVNWVPKHGGGVVSVTTVNGVDKALERVSADLDALPATFGRYLVPSAGTHNCRRIMGSSSRSMHAYGAAIDLNTQFAHYWRWGGGSLRWKNSYPREIIDIFEKHGFIWGGRWYHFDTMHFEYRPELLGRAPQDRRPANR